MKAEWKSVDNPPRTFPCYRDDCSQSHAVLGCFDDNRMRVVIYSFYDDGETNWNILSSEFLDVTKVMKYWTELPDLPM